jgi:tetratricopeptide (TPR) repeat protein
VPEAKEDEWDRAVECCVCAEHFWKEGRPAAEVEGLLRPACADDFAVAPAFALRGWLALERGRLAAALADAERAVALGQREPLAYLVRGRVRLERGAAGALDDLQKAAELSGRKDAVVLHWLAAGLFRRGQVEAALQAQREAVKLRPGDAELKGQLEEFERAGKGGK